MDGPPQVLPSLPAYRTELLTAGAPAMLPTVPYENAGLLGELPSPGTCKGWPWTIQTTSDVGGSWPKITVVMPSFRQAQYLEEAIRSVLLQNYPRLEFVIMDGGSADASHAIIEKYRPWLSYARSGPDRGQAHAINLGFSLGTGEIFAWLNSDDMYLPGCLRSVAEAWSRGAEFIYGDALELDSASGETKYALSHHVRAQYAKFGGLVFQPASFWSARRHQPVWEAQMCALDYELWIRLLPGLRIQRITAPLAVARKHDASKTYNPALQKRWEEDAIRNGQVHPELYCDSISNRWLGLEYRVVQRLNRMWHARQNDGQLATVCGECGWAVAHKSH